MFRKNSKRPLERIAKEVDFELAKKSPEEQAEINKEIKECYKKISLNKEEIELLRNQIALIKADFSHQQNLNAFIKFAADYYREISEKHIVPPSQKHLFILQQKYKIAGMCLVIDKLEEKIKEELQKQCEGNEIISALDNKIKDRKEIIEQLEKKIELLKTGKALDDYKPPNFSS